MPTPAMTARRRLRDRRGFSIIELMIVFLVFAVVVAIGVPRFNYMRETSNVRSAKSQIASALATARATAVRRSASAEVRRTGNSLVVLSGADTIVRPLMLDTLFKVSISTAPPSVRYDARGIASPMLDSTVRFVFSRESHSDSVCVSRIGAVMREGCLP
jgi:prepilin-type N-terminal cleavage/methylation domain-containing protein